MKQMIIGLIGNPNCGKTTLFNQLTGARQKVGNWAGVTVEKKEGSFKTDQMMVRLVDLPGTYSLTTISKETSLDEQIACQYILSGEADLLINVVDASNLEKSLYLTLQLLELGVPMIVVLNMLDIAQSQGIKVDIEAMCKQLGCPVVPMVSTKAQGVQTLKETIDHSPSSSFASIINYPEKLQAHTEQLAPYFSQQFALPQRRWLSYQVLEGDIYAREQLLKNGQFSSTQLDTLLAAEQDAALEIVNARYLAIQGWAHAFSPETQYRPSRFTALMDRLTLNRWLGLPIFFFVMYLMFFVSINLGGALQPIFDVGSSVIFIDGVQWFGHFAHLPEWLTVFLAQGIGGGINTVLPLIPQIGLMFLFLAFLEDTGYMARAAFVMDRLMQTLGLPGKSFVPLIVGFGCNVPAIMGTRTLDAQRERLITIMMSPFMSCGARLAIFAVFAGAFFGAHGASVVFSLYILGIAVAILTGLILKHTMMQGEAQPFVMELPVYHVPHLKTLILQTWHHLKAFVLRAGRVIVMFSILIGGLNSLTWHGQAADQAQDSILALVSHHLTPIFHPLGVTQDNWQAVVGLVTGAMAKEVVVGTLNTLYTAENIRQNAFDPNDFHPLNDLRDALAQTWSGVQEVFSVDVLANPIEASKGDGEISSGAIGTMARQFGTAVAAYAYLIFVLLYVPCASVMGAIARESNKSWMLFSIFWGLDMAYTLSTVFYQIATFSQHPQTSAMWILGLLVFNILVGFALKQSKDRVAKHLVFSASLSSANQAPVKGQCH